MTPTRVLVVDDSAFMRRTLRMILESDPELQVIDVARNGEEAVEKARALKPDVITLDLNMPVMDGLTALTYIMLERPTPVVVISSLTHEGALATFEALELGAVDFVSKSGTMSLDAEQLAEEIVYKVHSAVRAQMRRGRRERYQAQRGGRAQPRRAEVQSARRSTLPAAAVSSDLVVAIGVSTGGPSTLMDIVPALPADLPAAVIVVQHMPPKFTFSFAQHLNEASALPVKEAEANEPVQAGQVYVAPGGYHMSLALNARGTDKILRLSQRADQELLFCPSVDVMFDSVARLYGAKAVGVLLTGMGADGADGMVKIRQAGGFTIAESEETAVVFGMPREAIERGGADLVAPSHEIASHIRAVIRRLHR